MAPAQPSWRRCFEAEAAPGLRVSFQRYVRPADGLVHASLSSLGTLPIARGPDGTHLVAVPGNEAFWLGFTRDAGRRGPLHVTATVALADGRTALVTQPAENGLATLDGIRRPDGKLGCLYGAAAVADDPGAVVSVTIAVPAVGSQLTIGLVDPATFVARTGLDPPTPLDQTAGYAGWRLP